MSFTLSLCPIAVEDVLRILDPQPIISGYHLGVVCETFLTSGGQLFSLGERLTSVLRSRYNMYNVNQLKAKIKIVPVYKPGCAGTCPIDAVDHILLHVVRTCLTRS